MNELTVITNNTPRLLISGFELTKKERAEFDYLSEEELDCADFVKYRGQVYCLGDFSAFTGERGISEEFPGWDGYLSDSYFSGTLIKWVDDDFDRVIMGRYYC